MGSFSFGRVNNGKVVIQGEKVRVLVPQAFGGGDFTGIYDGYGKIDIPYIEDKMRSWKLDFYALIALFNLECISFQNESTEHLAHIRRELQMLRLTAGLTKKEQEKRRIEIYQTLNNEQVRNLGIKLSYASFAMKTDMYDGESIDIHASLPCPLRLISLKNAHRDYDAYKGLFSGSAPNQGFMRETLNENLMVCSTYLALVAKKYSIAIESLDVYAQKRQECWGTADLNAR